MPRIKEISKRKTYKKVIRNKNNSKKSTKEFELKISNS